MNINNQSFEHLSRNGTEFKCARCDFSFPVIVKKPPTMSEKDYLQDVSDMISYHVFNIWKQLNSFAGYDTIGFEIYVEE